MLNNIVVDFINDNVENLIQNAFESLFNVKNCKPEDFNCTSWEDAYSKIYLNQDLFFTKKFLQKI